jgi:hypothetical protein
MRDLDGYFGGGELIQQRRSVRDRHVEVLGERSRRNHGS